jgi:hypothetical protein
MLVNALSPSAGCVAGALQPGPKHWGTKPAETSHLPTVPRRVGPVGTLKIRLRERRVRHAPRSLLDTR